MVKEAKNYFWVLIDAALLVFVVSGVWCGVYVADRYAASLPITRTITVSGDGKTAAVPDLATISFAVVSEGKDLQIVQSDNTKKMNAAIDFVKGQGVDAKDIQTSGYNLLPTYTYDGKKHTSTISGYTMTQTVTLKIRAFEKIPLILGQLQSLGVNEVNGVNFSVEDPEAYMATAREMAFARAYEKAATMAKQNGVRLGRVVTFSENQPVYPRFLEAAPMMKGGMGASAPAPTIEPGSEEVNVNVSVTYELR